MKEETRTYSLMSNRKHIRREKSERGPSGYTIHHFLSISNILAMLCCASLADWFPLAVPAGADPLGASPPPVLAKIWATLAGRAAPLPAFGVDGASQGGGRTAGLLSGEVADMLPKLAKSCWTF